MFVQGIIDKFGLAQVNEKAWEEQEDNLNR